MSSVGAAMHCSSTSFASMCTNLPALRCRPLRIVRNPKSEARFARCRAGATPTRGFSKPLQWMPLTFEEVTQNVFLEQV